MEQLFRFTNAPSAAVEKELIATLTRALANTNLPSNPAPNAESELLAARGMELATRRTPFQPRTARTRTQWDAYKQQLEQYKKLADNRAATLATYERTLLRDPKNLEAKTMLGYGLLGDPDPGKREHGKELMREVVATKDPKYADRAYRHLTNAAWLARMAGQGAPPPQRPTDWQSVNQAFEENPSDLESRCDLGAALLTLPRAGDRKRGRELLAEVAAGGRANQVDRARKLLDEPEKHPAIPDDLGKPSAAAQPTVARSSGDPVPDDVPPPEDEVSRARREFLQQHFAKFVPATFEKDGPQLAKFQRVPAKENMFDYQGKHYCGFRFTIPEWLDGDLQWMYLLAKSEAEKDFFADGFQWFIVPKSGRMKGFESFNNLNVASYPKLAERFPHTKTLCRQTLPKQYLKPGQEYAIWFSFKDSNLPDIAVAMTIQSRRGYAQIGILPLR